jgi:hypothetical protein
MWTAVALSIVAELFEAWWQRADTLKGALERSYYYFRTSIFLLLVMHTGYLATLFISLRYNLLNWPIVGILAFKTMDIFFKLDMIRRIWIVREIDVQMEAMLSTTIPRWYFLVGVVTYPYFIYWAFRIAQG